MAAYINSRSGNIAVPAVINRLRSEFCRIPKEIAEGLFHIFGVQDIRRRKAVLIVSIGANLRHDIIRVLKLRFVAVGTVNANFRRRRNRRIKKVLAVRLFYAFKFAEIIEPEIKAVDKINRICKLVRRFVIGKKLLPSHFGVIHAPFVFVNKRKPLCFGIGEIRNFKLIVLCVIFLRFRLLLRFFRLGTAVRRAFRHLRQGTFSLAFFVLCRHAGSEKRRNKQNA